MSSLYSAAEQKLSAFLAKQGHAAGIKSLVYGEQDSSTQPGVKSVYALVCETVRYKTVLEDCIVSTPLKADDNARNHNMLLILVYELLMGKQSIQGGGQLKKLVMKHQNALRARLARLKISAGARSNEELLPKELRPPPRIPRYARVNTLRASLEDVKTALEADGFAFVAPGSQPPDRERKTGPKPVFCDPHVPNVLVFEAGTVLFDHALVRGGQLILQDKASCFSAAVLDPSRGWRLLDAAAAPGNKTSHLAALAMVSAGVPPGDCKSGKVVLDAFEINAERCGLLRRMLARAGAEGVVRVHQASFLACDPHSPGSEFAGVQAILLDPTCSGSGMIQRIEQVVRSRDDQDRQNQQQKQKQERKPKPQATVDVDEAGGEDAELASLESDTIAVTSSGSKQQQRQHGEQKERKVAGGSAAKASAASAPEAKEKERILALAEFQLSMVKHALSFPKLQRLVYSTCSIHAEENECVVREALKAFPEFELTKALPSWPRRGVAVPGLDQSQAAKCVRVSAHEDLMNGFFVARFDRRAASSASSSAASAPKAAAASRPASGSVSGSASGSFASAVVSASKHKASAAARVSTAAKPAVELKSAAARVSRKRKRSDADSAVDSEPDDADEAGDGSEDEPLSSSGTGASSAGAGAGAGAASGLGLTKNQKRNKKKKDRLKRRKLEQAQGVAEGS